MAEVDPQPLGNGPHVLSVGDRQTDLVGDPLGQQQGPFLVATRAEASLAAGERNEHFVAALRAAAPHAGEAEVKVAATEELADHIADDGPPKSVAFLIPLGIKLFEL